MRHVNRFNLRSRSAAANKSLPLWALALTEISPLTSNLQPLTSHLSPLTSYLLPLSLSPVVTIQCQILKSRSDCPIMVLSCFCRDRADRINLESGTEITVEFDLKILNNSGYRSLLVSPLTDRVDFVWYWGH